MEVAVALALLFFCVLLLASGTIAFLLIRHCLAALRRRPSADADPEARAPAAPRHRQPQPAAAAAAKPKQQQQPLLIAAVKKEAQVPRRLAWREVEALTGGFDEAAVVGRGGSSTVYLARLMDGSPVAVKVHRWCGGERRLRAFRQELDLLRRLRHPNIVALLAYSDDHGEFIRACAPCYSSLFPSLFFSWSYTTQKSLSFHFHFHSTLTLLCSAPTDCPCSLF
jgi:hypothetical protein